MDCLQSEIRLRHDGKGRRSERGRQDKVSDDGEGGKEHMAQSPERVIPLRMIRPQERERYE